MGEKNVVIMFMEYWVKHSSMAQSVGLLLYWGTTSRSFLSSFAMSHLSSRNIIKHCFFKLDTLQIPVSVVTAVTYCLDNYSWGWLVMIGTFTTIDFTNIVITSYFNKLKTFCYLTCVNVPYFSRYFVKKFNQSEWCTRIYRIITLIFTTLLRVLREEIQKQQAKAHYQKLHIAGKTDEARADLARLALIRKQREEAQKKRDQEKQRKSTSSKCAAKIDVKSIISIVPIYGCN